MELHSEAHTMSVQTIQDESIPSSDTFTNFLQYEFVPLLDWTQLINVISMIFCIIFIKYLNLIFNLVFNLTVEWTPIETQIEYISLEGMIFFLNGPNYHYVDAWWSY